MNISVGTALTGHRRLSSGVSPVTPPRCADSLSGVTKVNEPSSDDGLPPPWLIVVPIVGALAFVFFLGVGVEQEWGAEQWGPVAAWLAGAATFAAVVVALWQANIARREAADLQVARLVDHEASRRRECIKAHSDLWAGIVGMAIEFSAFTDYLDNLPQDWPGSSPRTDGVPPERPGEPFTYEVGRHFQTFYDTWVGAIQPPLLVALATLYGTGVYDAVNAINEAITKMSRGDTEGGFIAVREAIFVDAQQGIGHRPDTKPLTAMWQDITRRRCEHLLLMQQHFSLNREDIERAVLH
jgi:hypothetical protein